MSYPALAPSQYLLQKWKNREITWEDFESQYRKEISHSDKAQAHLETLHQKYPNRFTNPNPSFITLLCYETERNPHCNHHVLKNIIEGR